MYGAAKLWIQGCDKLLYILINYHYHYFKALQLPLPLLVKCSTLNCFACITSTIIITLLVIPSDKTMNDIHGISCRKTVIKITLELSIIN